MYRVINIYDVAEDKFEITTDYHEIPSVKEFIEAYEEACKKSPVELPLCASSIKEPPYFMAFVINNELNILVVYNINIMSWLLEYFKNNIVSLCSDEIKNIANANDFRPEDALDIFQKANGLTESDFDYTLEFINVLEELLEPLFGDEARERAQRILNDVLADLPDNVLDNLNYDNLIDSFADIGVIARGALLKLKTNPDCVFKEVSKIINSRKGKIIDGKYTKCKTDECKDLWYEPDFEKCKHK